MKKLMALGLGFSLLTGAGVAQAEPGGCLKYGAAGAVGGHVVHHGVLGAASGCVVGMYTRHKYRQQARSKAALYDKEHPGAKGSYAEKATAYDVEHSTNPDTPANSTAPAAAQPTPGGPDQKTQF